MAKLVLGGIAEPTYVRLTEEDGKPLHAGIPAWLAAQIERGEFLVRPITVSMQRDWQRRFHFCPTCNGLTFLPYGPATLANCPKCRDKAETPSYQTPEIRVKVAEEICLGWRTFTNDGGEDYDFPSELSVVDPLPAIFWAFWRAGIALGETQAAALGKA